MSVRGYLHDQLHRWREHEGGGVDRREEKARSHTGGTLDDLHRYVVRWIKLQYRLFSNLIIY